MDQASFGRVCAKSIVLRCMIDRIDHRNVTKQSLNLGNVDYTYCLPCKNLLGEQKFIAHLLLVVIHFMSLFVILANCL